MQLLIGLELFKFKKIKRYLIFCVLITIGMCLFTTISLFAIEQDRAANYNDAIKMMNAAIIDCYLIFSGVLITKVIVEEYTKKNGVNIVYLFCQQTPFDDGKGVVSAWSNNLLYDYYRTYQHHLFNCGWSIYEAGAEQIQ